jgi:hypothetical protein
VVPVKKTSVVTSGTFWQLHFTVVKSHVRMACSRTFKVHLDFMPFFFTVIVGFVGAVEAE